MNSTNPLDTQLLEHLLAWPVCKAKLDFSPDVIRCTSCSLQFHQFQKNYFDLLPYHLLKNERGQWRGHQREQESDIRKWISQGFEIIRRAWIGQYLTFELRKT